MRLDQSVTVTCTDTDKEMTGTVVRLRGDFVDVAVGSLILNLNRKLLHKFSKSAGSYRLQLNYRSLVLPSLYSSEASLASISSSF